MDHRPLTIHRARTSECEDILMDFEGGRVWERSVMFMDSSVHGGMEQASSNVSA